VDFCYLVQQNILDKLTLDAIDAAVARFHANRVIFEDVSICIHFSLPRQHSMKHFQLLIQMFGAPNGLCSSITESKHIKAVKEPYRQSSHFEALGQMLLTNQRLDKLAACGMLGPMPSTEHHSYPFSAATTNTTISSES
jgi:hypothetical protein